MKNNYLYESRCLLVHTKFDANQVIQSPQQMIGFQDQRKRRHIPSGKAITYSLFWWQPSRSCTLPSHFPSSFLWEYPFSLAARARRSPHIMTNWKSAGCVDTMKFVLRWLCKVSTLYYFVLFSSWQWQVCVVFREQELQRIDDIFPHKFFIAVQATNNQFFEKWVCPCAMHYFIFYAFLGGNLARETTVNFL